MARPRRTGDEKASKSTVSGINIATPPQARGGTDIDHLREHMFPAPLKFNVEHAWKRCVWACVAILYSFRVGGHETSSSPKAAPTKTTLSLGGTGVATCGHMYTKPPRIIQSVAIFIPSTVPRRWVLVTMLTVLQLLHGVLSKNVCNNVSKRLRNIQRDNAIKQPSA